MIAYLLNDCSTYHVGSKLVTEQIHRLAKEVGIELVNWTPESPVEEAQLVIVNGEGTLHHDAPRALTIMSQVEALKRRGAKIVLINATVQAMSGDFSPFERIVVRESKSKAFLRNHGYKGSVEVIPDIAFCFEHNIMGRTPKGGILFIDSVYEAVSRETAELAKENGEEMLRLCEDKRDANSLIALMRTKSLVVTGRFHAAILAFLAGTPVVTLPSNTWKMPWMMRDFSRGEYHFGKAKDVAQHLKANGGGATIHHKQIVAIREDWRNFFQTLADPDWVQPRTEGVDAAALEKAKYDGIFQAKGRYTGYGHSNHGKEALKHVLETMKAVSVLDIGCGWNEFIKSVRKQNPNIPATGVDFSCPGADIVCSAEKMPFRDREFDVLTSFDMLEHVLESQVDSILAEFARVSNRFVVAIQYQPSVIEWKGENLHPCVHAEEWWMMRLMRAGGVNIRKQGRYITGEWRPALKLAPDTRIILVGNGPSAMRVDGKVVDSFDEVVRFNTYHTDPEYAANTGTKTTLWSTFGKGCLPGVEERPKRLLYIHGETGEPAYQPETKYIIPHWYYGHVGDAVRAHNEWLTGFAGDPWRPTRKRALTASSGLLVASFLLQVVGVKQLTLAGFDHFQKEESKQHHYWNAGSWGKPKEHSADVEDGMFTNLERNGRVVYLPYIK